MGRGDSHANDVKSMGRRDSHANDVKNMGGGIPMPMMSGTKVVKWMKGRREVIGPM
jgi:hypothetical protein